MADPKKNEQQNLQADSAPVAASEIAELRGLIVAQAAAAAKTQAAQAESIDKLIAVITAQAVANAQTPPVGAHAGDAASTNINVQWPDREQKAIRDREKVEAMDRALTQKKISDEARLAEGAIKYDICVMYENRKTNRSAIVGASSPAEAEEKYRRYFGITGMTYPARLVVVPVMPPGMSAMLGQPVGGVTMMVGTN